MTTKNQLNILNNCEIPINNKIVIKLTNDNINSIDYETKRKCKILKFSSDFDFNQILLTLIRLESECYPNLLIFIIEDNNFRLSGEHLSRQPENLSILHNFLSEFGKSRPKVLQLPSSIDKIARIYYKEENVEDFVDLEPQSENLETFDDFSTFLWFYCTQNLDNFEAFVLEKLPQVKNSAIILRFLRTLELSFGFWIELVEKCAQIGTKCDLLAAIDAPLDNNFTVQELDPENFLSWMIGTTSVLHKAVQNLNLEIIKFLVKICSESIQQLPLDHQIEISTIAFETNQIEVLCDLIELVDFPFPKDLNLESVTSQELHKIVENRAKFHEILLAENLKEIEKFASQNPKVKFAYNLDNKSALCSALDSKKFQSFFLLQSLRYEDKEIEHYSNKLKDEDDRKNASKFAAVQRRQNANISTQCAENVVQLLLVKSFIYNRNSTNEASDKVNETIKKWFEEINKTSFGPKLLNAAMQCENLKIIFDFECDSVKNVDVSQSSASLGVTYPYSNFIFIGAKLSGEKSREQQIKGVLAHEICHYVMRLVYQNNESPFYKGDEEAALKFDEMVTEIRRMFYQEKFQAENNDEVDEVVAVNEADVKLDEGSTKKIKEMEAENETPDDECDGNISSVYACYDAQDWIAELIVRPFHIQAQFDDNKKKLEELEIKYSSLFRFCEKFVVPELDKFNLEDRKGVQNFNNAVGLLADVRNSKLEFSKVEDISDIFKNQLIIVTSNIPKLFLLNVYKILNAKDEDFVDVHNIFINPQVMKNSYIHEKFKEILAKFKSLKIFVDCTNGFKNILNVISSIDLHKIIFVMSSEQQSDELCRKLEDKRKNATKVTRNFNWMDLTTESQKILLKYKVKFQNSSKIQLYELIGVDFAAQQENFEHLSVIFDAQLLTKLLEKEQVTINLQTSEITFDILFQTRNLIQVTNVLVFGRKEQKFQELTIDKMLEEIKNQKFVLISDKAGSGKSWILKNFTNLLKHLFPIKWTTYIDLKQFVDEFRAANVDLEFSSFVAEKLFKLKSNFEAEIFKNLYKIGRVCILFDGFDEIAPNCAEFVSNLAQSFQSNEGNQLWISTRDYFEVSLTEKLEIKVFYKLDEFTEAHGIELIASCWTLNYMKTEFEQHLIRNLQSHPDYQNFKSQAAKISQKVSKLQTYSIGLPQFYKMLAEILKDAKDSTMEFSVFDLFEECVNIQYRRWSDEKGKLRKKESILSQHKDLNYHKFHELIAMKSLHPEKSKFSDLDYEDLEYSDEEIIAFGMLSKIGKNFLFPHETFREYYAAKYIIRTLMRSDEESVKYFIEFLTIWKYGIIRMFINEALTKEAVVNKIEGKLRKIAGIFATNLDSKMNFLYIFRENLLNLVDLFLKILKLFQNYEQVKGILSQNASLIKLPLQRRIMFLKVHSFIAEYLSQADFKELISKFKILKLIFTSQLTPDDIRNAILAIELKIDSKFITAELQMTDEEEENLLFGLVRSTNDIEEKFEIIKNYLTVDEILKLAMKRNFEGDSILKVCIGNKSKAKLQLVWNMLEKAFKSQNCHDEFVQLVAQKSTFDETIFHKAANCEDIEFHQALWDAVEKTVQISVDLQALITQKDKDECNFIYFQTWTNSEIVEFTMKKAQENLSPEQYREFLMSKGFNGKNLLHKAAMEVKNIETFQFLWKTFQNLFKSIDEFIDVLNEVDSTKNNIFHYIATWSTDEIAEFILIQLEVLTTSAKIKNLLSVKNSYNQNFLQRATDSNKSCQLHSVLWRILRKYFNYSEILEIILNSDENGFNIFQLTFRKNTKTVFKLMCKEVQDILQFNDKISLKIKGICLEILTIIIKNLDDSKNISSENVEKLVLELKTINFFHPIVENPNQEIFATDPYFIHKLAFCDEIKIHEAFWSNENENLMDLMQQKDANGKNFIQKIIANDNYEVVKLAFTKLKELLNNEQYQLIVSARVYKNYSLLHAAARESKNVKTVQILWKVIHNLCISDEEFMKLLEEVDSENNNIFHLMAGHSTSEIFEFAIQETEKIAGKEKVISFLYNLGHCNGSLLHSALMINTSLKLHKKLWEIFENYLNLFEVLKLINHCDLEGDNILHQAVYWNRKGIVEFTWSKIKFYINIKERQMEYLYRTGHMGHNLKQMSLENQSKDNNVNIWIETLLKEMGLCEQN